MLNRSDMLNEYFKRIGYEGSRDVSVETLKAINRAHIFSVPFENLEIHEQQNIDNRYDFIKLDIESVFDKIVRQRRGGYCLETNELLAFVLTELGFKVEFLMGRALVVPNLSKGHKMLRVTVGDEKWIADVGFGGDGLFEPIPLITEQAFCQYGNTFRLVEDETKHVLQMLTHDKWKDLLEFSSEAVRPVDYENFNYAISHNPESFFVKNRFAVIARPEGRIILFNYHLKIMTDGREENSVLPDEAAYLAVLQKYFGIELNNPLKPVAVDAKSERSEEPAKKISVAHVGIFRAQPVSSLIRRFEELAQGAKKSWLFERDDPLIKLRSLCDYWLSNKAILIKLGV